MKQNPFFAKIVTAAAFLLLVSAPVRSEEVVPGEAKQLIDKVHDAALARDFEFLQSVMTDDFSYSGSKAGSAAFVVDRWRKQPAYLDKLAEITGMSCKHDAPFVECPRGAGLFNRAGFVRDTDGWKMIYFVTGP